VRVVTTSGPCWPIGGSTMDYLEGVWRADREVTDFRSGRTGSFLGTATLARPPGDGAASSLPGALAYREEGELRFGEHHGPAARRLLYVPQPDGTAEVLFADGRPFFGLDLRSGFWTAEHPCGRDHYLVTFRVLDADHFTEHWRVRGPDKDYEMATTLARTGAPA
jgi:hypothetical protein